MTSLHKARFLFVLGFYLLACASLRLHAQSVTTLFSFNGNEGELFDPIYLKISPRGGRGYH